jgi:2-haloacid dehalogenase
LQSRHADFWEVTGDGLDFALDTLGLDDPRLRRLMDLYRTLDAFPEVPAMLHRLKAVGLKTAILADPAFRARDGYPIHIAHPALSQILTVSTSCSERVMKPD